MKTVVITGVSRGIGRVVAQMFLYNGDFVIGTSTSGTASLAHKNLIILQLDLADPASIERCTEEIKKTNRKIDILINNAGIWSNNEHDPVIHIPMLRKVLEVNLIGTVDFTERLLGSLNQGAHVVNVSSRAGSMGYAKHGNNPDYKISKAALNMFTKILAFRLEGRGIASSIHPGWTKTDMGGMDADREPEEAAKEIVALANSQVESGQFWFKGEKFPW